jgi:pSer/pThr/pTyr-binding forkhead associated (FHA) protein
MMQLELGGQRYAIGAGEMVIGSDAGCALPLSGEGVQPRHAIVQGMADGSAAVRRASASAELKVNGVDQGDNPVPILHGDKLQIGSHEILVVDPAHGGNTSFFDSSAFQKFSNAPAAPKPTRPAASGGRMVCLTDGREYQVGAGPLVIGRDASCDIVVPGNDVSRRHAQIVPGEDGYVLMDLSTNGTLVNGTRIEGAKLLQRADVLRIGPDEFRFYADVPVGAGGGIAAEAAPAPAAPPSEPPSGPPAGAEHRLFNTMHGLPGVGGPPPSGPVTPISAVGAPIASLLVRSGTLKGKRLTVRVPVVNIGRADFNDLVIPEPSVSASHAKLQRREDIWVISDLGSTNGTFVDGERIEDETALGPGSTIRFGEVTTLFESTDDVTGIQPRVGTRMMEGLAARAPAAVPEPAPEPSPPPARRRPPIRAPAPRARVLPGWVILAALVAIAAVLAYLLFT